MFKSTGKHKHPELMKQAEKYSWFAKHKYDVKGKPSKAKPYCTKPK